MPDNSYDSKTKIVVFYSLILFHLILIRTKPGDDADDDDEENNASSQLDPLDAAMYRMAERNEIQLLPPRSTRGGRHANKNTTAM